MDRIIEQCIRLYAVCALCDANSTLLSKLNMHERLALFSMLTEDKMRLISIADGLFKVQRGEVFIRMTLSG